MDHPAITHHSHHRSRSTQTVISGENLLKTPIFSIERLKENQKELHFYTGLEDYSKFKLVFDTLRCKEMSYIRGVCNVLPLMDQFLVTLVKLRQYKTNFELSCLFGGHLSFPATSRGGHMPPLTILLHLFPRF